MNLIKQLSRIFKYQAENDPDDIIANFYKTTIHTNEHLDFEFSSFEAPESWKKVQYKSYPNRKQIPLALNSLNEYSLEKALHERKSVRAYSSKAVEFDKISQLIHYSAGRLSKGDEQKEFRRFYPSAGARFPTETYLILQNTKGIDHGIYHHNAKDQSLEHLKSLPSDDITNKLFYKMLNVEAANFIILNGAIPRLSNKYGTNAYRYALLECGHIAQNISLIACSLGLGTLMLGGYYNAGLSKLIENDKTELPLYVIAFGYEKS